MFSKRLRECRVELGYSQSKLAELVGVSKQNISDWENGKSETNFDMLIKLARALDISVGQLIGSEDF